MIFKIFDLALSLAPFQTGRAQMQAVEFHIAKGAQEPTAGAARNDRFLFRVVKTACLVIHYQGLAGSPWRMLPEERREGVHLYRCAAGRAGGHAGSVYEFFAEGPPAFGACNHKRKALPIIVPLGEWEKNPRL